MTSNIPAITTDQMRNVDNLMINKYGIELIQMMENAGRNLADLTQLMMRDNFKIATPKSIVVVCGLGNNGGGGMVAARHLSNRGYAVTIVLTGAEDKLKSVPLKQWNILKSLPVSMIIANSSDYLGIFSDTDIIIDAVIGYGMSGKIRGIPANVIHEILNSQNPRVLSLDAPSGLNTTTGEFSEGFCVKASATMTLALPKKGLLHSNAIKCVGKLYVADIGVPPELLGDIELTKQYIFQDSPIIQII